MNKNKSPLRYPGGKTRAIKILDKYIETYFKGRKRVLSPFFGGGSFEIYLQGKGYEVLGNDLFKPLYEFWSSAQENPRKLAETVKSMMPITKEKFGSLRNAAIITAAAYYCINRCSFSGSTFCGGYSSQAAVGRLNDSSLETLKRVDLSRIVFSNKDCIAFLKENEENANTFIYADPPYYIESYIYGKDGDLHEAFDHKAFALYLKTRADWILSYNDCEYIRELYKDCTIIKEVWSYGMNASKKSSEIIILPLPS
jgi:DNA adenine methylase